MLLRLPRGLHYPITITKVLKKAGSNVAKDEPIFLYTYETIVREGNRGGEDKYVKKAFPAKFESGLEGQLKFWKVWEGDVFDKPADVAEIEEECAHSEQFAGMCTNCGKDMTIVSSYNNDANDADRAPFQTSHDTQMLRISEREASRREEEAKRRLLASRKLSLVVDLDQTIIHAAVDPTIAEWQKDKDNPNYEAVKDVRAFQLIDDGPGMRGCWYYIKLRPGLQEFLEQISQSYELHIYTMGTRQYAEQIANIVDPDRKYFGDRILSRDESGSMTNKTLKRLFPIDTKMVVIIDDRGDVWKWNANLVRVVPFDFFVGIGDINSSFLPKQQEIAAAPKSDKPDDVKPEGASTDDQEKSQLDEKTKDGKENGPSTAINGSDTSALEQLVAMGGGDDPVVREIQSKGQEDTIAAQVEEKPLLQMQKLLDAKDQEAAAAAAAAAVVPESTPENTTPSNPTPNGDTQDSSAESASPSSSSSSSEADEPPPVNPPIPPATRHSLLRDNDRELPALTTRLRALHTAFYTDYDRQRLGQKGGRVAALSSKGRKTPLLPPSASSSTLTDDGAASDLLLVPDVKTVLPAMKQRVLAGVVIVFSGVLPLDVDIQTADISLWAKTFGARIEGRVGRGVTHVVAARPGTSKVKQGWRRGIWVVGTGWLVDSLNGWGRVGEKGYTLVDLDKGGGAEGRKEGMKRTTRDRERGFLLSDDEADGDGETTGLDTEAENEDKRKATGKDGDAQRESKRLKLEIDKPSQEDTAAATITAAADTDPLSTFIDDDNDASHLSINQDEWADMDKELREFIGSDVESDDSETESMADQFTSSTGNTNKRKREDEGEGETEENEVDSLGQRRGGFANANNANTNHAVGNDSPSNLGADGDADADEDAEIRLQRREVESAQAREEEEELSSDDELARELEREFEDSSGEDEGGFMSLGGKDAGEDVEEGMEAGRGDDFEPGIVPRLGDAEDGSRDGFITGRETARGTGQ